MVLLGAASAANAQAIDMSKAHSATISNPSISKATSTSPLPVQHARVPLWTRIVVQQDAQGNTRIGCAVEPRPNAHIAKIPSDITNTTSLPTHQ